MALFADRPPTESPGPRSGSGPLPRTLRLPRPTRISQSFSALRTWGENPPNGERTLNASREGGHVPRFPCVRVRSTAARSSGSSSSWPPSASLTRRRHAQLSCLCPALSSFGCWLPSQAGQRPRQPQLSVLPLSSSRDPSDACRCGSLHLVPLPAAVGWSLVRDAGRLPLSDSSSPAGARPVPSLPQC